MEKSVPSLLLVQCSKTLLDWLVVLVQSHYMLRSFSGFFCISLALIDTLASCIFVAIFYLENFCISGWHITHNHIWLLAEVVCFIHAHLHWPVFLLTGLDHLWSLPTRTQKLVYVAGVGLLWVLGALYVFLEPELAVYVGGDEMFKSPQSSQVLCALLLIVVCLILCSYAPLERQKICVFEDTGGQICLGCLRQVWSTFLRTWGSFIILLLISPLLETDINKLLQLNVIWVCFLNSFWFSLSLCSYSFSSRNDSITDGFCSWKGCVTCGADEWKCGKQSSNCSQVKTLDV